MCTKRIHKRRAKQDADRRVFIARNTGVVEAHQSLKNQLKQNVLLFFRARFKATLGLCLVFLLISTTSVIGQQRENKKVKLLGKVETRNSFVQTHYATYLGVRAGVEFKFPVRCGLGYYWMFTQLDSKLADPSQYGQATRLAHPKMRYAVGYVGFSFYEQDDWTLSVPVQIGIGESFYKSEESNRFANGLIIPMEAGVSVDYLFSKWMGFGVGLGYRIMLKENKEVKENFNSPYYQLRFNIAFSEIVRGIKAKKKP